MKQDGWQPLLMWLENSVDHAEVLDVSRALVVHNDVKSLRPVGVVIDRILMAGAVVRIVSDRPFDIGPRGNAFRNDLFLRRVIVAAAAENEAVP